MTVVMTQYVWDAVVSVGPNRVPKATMRPMYGALPQIMAVGLEVCAMRLER